MLCDVCHKNDATVHLTEIVDNQIAELHLCEQCAQQKGAQMEQHFGLADFLAGLADLGSQFDSLGKSGKSGLKCPNCGLTYQDFRRIGRLGCSECYQAFRDSLIILLKRIHGSTQHLGGSPVGGAAAVKRAPITKKKSELETLRMNLQKAVETEAFEEAARLRDKIRAIEAKKAGGQR